jgi:drug/metabolite transporter (DMT)-like permease
MTHASTATESAAPIDVGVRISSVLLFTVIYAACFTIIKAGLAYAPPLRYGGLRALMGGSALLAVVLVQRGSLLPERRTWLSLLALALTSTTITFIGMFLSPGRAGAGIASVLGNTQPLFAVLLGAVLLDERVTRATWTALALGLLGVILIAVPTLTPGGVLGVAGALLALMASAGSAVGSVIVKRMRPRNLLATAGWQLLIGSMPLLIASSLVERDAPITWNGAFIAMLLFLALVGTSFATALWYWLIARTEVGRLTLFLFLTPVLGLALAVVVFGERIAWIQGIGIGVTLLGVAVTLRADQRRPHAH